MMMRNKLSPSFEKYNLTERDVTFIKELIAATVLETTICTSEVWFSILCEKRVGEQGQGDYESKVFLQKNASKVLLPILEPKTIFFFCTLLKALANVTIKGCLTASTGTCFITVGRIEFTSKKSKELWDQLFQNNCSCNLRIKSPFLYFLSSTLRQSCGILKITQFEEREKYCDLWITCIYLY